MKNWKSILLTVLALLMLTGFARALTSPVITEEAKEYHRNLETPSESEDEGDDLYDFL